MAAARFRYFQRLSENGTIPDHALMSAKEQRDKMLVAQGGAPRSEPITWTWIGPGNVGGRIRSVIIHPMQTNTIWVGSVGGGIWKTTNGGTSWAPLDDFMADLAVGCMAIDPTDANVLYAGTGEGFFESLEGSSNTAAIRGAGIFTTTNGGTTWAQMPSTANPSWYFVNRLAISPTNHQIILAATGTGLYRTTDAGGTWALVSAGYMYDVQFHPTDGAKAVAGRHAATPIYSNDGGQTWTAATGANGHRVELRYARNLPTTVYAAAMNNNAVTIYRSTDGGQTYALRTSGGGLSCYSAYNCALWVDPTNSNTLLVGGVNIARSTDGGTTLPSAFSVVHADQHAMVEQPGFNGTTARTLYFGCDGGIHRTTNAYGTSTNVSELNNNLGITQFYGAAVSPTGVVIAGAQDNGTQVYTGGTETWTSVFGGDGGYCAADPTDANYLYGEIYYIQIVRSADGGNSANYIYQGIGDAGNSSLSNFISHFVVDVNNPNRMLAGGAQLWRTNNVKAGTPSWASIKPGIPPSPRPPGASDPVGAHFLDNPPLNISTIAIAEGNSDVIWVGYNNGQVWRTANGTSANPTWTRVDRNGVGLPSRWISRIVIDRHDSNRVYVAIMGWNDNNLWRTTDAGATWADISGSGATGLPFTPVASFAQHRVYPNRLYAGTDIGMFTSLDDGQNWSVTTQGPGTVPVDELVWKNDETLMAVTHGRGVFYGDVTPAPCPGDVNGDRAVDLSDLAILLAHFGTASGATLAQGDLSGDGDVDLDDLAALLAHFGTTCP